MATAMENWDDDVDFQGDLFTHSVSTVQTSISSRLSVHSESNFGDDDWQVQFTSNDDASTNNAIQSAKQAGVPIPSNVPSSALLGGTIQRLGKKAPNPITRQKTIDDWDDDMEIPSAGLTLKAKKDETVPTALSAFAEEDNDEFDDDWAEGSLGIRFAGTRRDTRNRSLSAGSALSPSVASMTVESEDDELNDLELPEGPVDLQAMLKKRQAADAAQLPSAEEVQIEQPKAKTAVKSTLLSEDTDDFFKDLDVGGAEVFDPKKLTLHRNIKQKSAKPTPAVATRAPTTTLTFTDKPAATRIPRPVLGGKPAPSRLEPVFESGATQITRPRQPPPPTTTGAQLLRSKRSMPVMRSNYQSQPKPLVPFVPAGSSVAHSHHVAAKPTPYHLRRDSDPYRSQSPPPRSLSRLSNAYVPDTPSRTSRRTDFAPAALAREAASKKTLTRPQRKRVFGDGTELNSFDDLPISATKESKFLKQPSTRGAPKSLRIVKPSDMKDGLNSKLPLPDRMTTPLPGPMTPKSPLKVFQEPSNNTPRYLRDTAASRIARESRLANTTNARPRSDGPLMPVSTNWKAQIAARSPHTSPSAARNKGKRVQPNLIRPNEAPTAKTEKGMVFNPATLRWEGNENSLGAFDFPPPLQTPTPQSTTFHHHQPLHHLPHNQYSAPPPPSPPRPALIAPMSAGGTKNVQVVGGMVFDPARMCWLKFKPTDGKPGDAKARLTHLNHRSPSVTDNDDDEDPFAGIDDLTEARAESTKGSAAQGGNAPPAGKSGLANQEWLVGEEFDLGPEFIRRQKEEEVAWRKKCEAWFADAGDDGARLDGDDFRWRIREIAGMPV